MASDGPNMECRMYEAKYPEVDHTVMIRVKSMADSGAYVSLLEYNNIEGMILFSELSCRRIRSISSLIKVGRIEPVMVLCVDKEKGYIDLSKRRVFEEEIQGCEKGAAARRDGRRTRSSLRRLRRLDSPSKGGLGANGPYTKYIGAERRRRSGAATISGGGGRRSGTSNIQ